MKYLWDMLIFLLFFVQFVPSWLQVRVSQLVLILISQKSVGTGWWELAVKSDMLKGTVASFLKTWLWSTTR